MIDINERGADNDRLPNLLNYSCFLKYADNCRKLPAFRYFRGTIRNGKVGKCYDSRKDI